LIVLIVASKRLRIVIHPVAIPRDQVNEDLDVVGPTSTFEFQIIVDLGFVERTGYNPAVGSGYDDIHGVDEIDTLSSPERHRDVRGNCHSIPVHLDLNGVLGR